MGNADLHNHPDNVELSPEVAENPRSDAAENEAETSKLSPIRGNHEKPYPITDAVRRQRSVAGLKTSLKATSKTALELRNKRTRYLMRRMEQVLPWLDPADRPTLRAWCELEILAASCFTILAEGVVNEQGQPKKLLDSYRLLRATQAKYLMLGLGVG